MTSIPPDMTRVNRLIVRAPNWLGDALLALPAMAAIRRHFADATLAIAAPPAIAAMFREVADVCPDEVMELTGSPRSMTATIAAGHFELGILFPNSFRSAWMLRKAGVPQRWGVARAMRGSLLTKRAVRARSHGVMHQAEYDRALVRGLGMPCGDEAPALGVSAASRLRAESLMAARGVAPGARIVALAPGAAYGQSKQWLPDRVAALAARLVRDRDATCVIVGAAHDQPASRAIESWLGGHAREVMPRVIDFVGRTDLGALCGVLAASDVLVSNDSGAMHLGSAVGAPVVAIFGSTDERATRPLGAHTIVTASVFCRPCMLRDCPIDHRCMKRVTVDAVFAAVSRHLAFGRSR